MFTVHRWDERLKLPDGAILLPSVWVGSYEVH
jgi:hypothetical protein